MQALLPVSNIIIFPLDGQGCFACTMSQASVSALCIKKDAEHPQIASLMFSIYCMAVLYEVKSETHPALAGPPRARGEGGVQQQDKRKSPGRKSANDMQSREAFAFWKWIRS